MKWLNEPNSWSNRNNIIEVNSDCNTDFWRKTHYGFIRDNGHFYYEKVTGNFVATVKISGEYRDIYDQAGLMVRLDEENWLKFGIELVEGVQHVSAVVTRDYSDWSVVPMPNNPPAIWLRINSKGSAMEIDYSIDNQRYTMLRIAYLTSTETLEVGIMCASPQGKGFTTIFEGFKVTPY